jgi:ubiquinone/menaquinone biosynthesis C-methylase UbiE
VPGPDDRYTHGHHESVLRSHRWRTAQNSAGFLLEHLSPGQDLLDVGCGPGTITTELAALTAPGRTVGIDLSADVIETARRWQAERGLSSVDFEPGNVYELAFADSSFDVVYAHQVLQHLSDPVAALVEMRRVLRDGGVLAVRDSDYDAFVWAPDDPRLDRWMEIYQQITTRNNATANAGRYLPAWVRAAGYRDLEVSSSTWTFHDREQREWWGSLWADRVRESEFARQGIEYRLTSSEELDGIAEAFHNWADDDNGVFVVVHVEVLAALRRSRRRST